MGICVQGLDASCLERGLVGSVGSLVCMDACVCSVHPVSYFKMAAHSRSKFHVSVSHSTVLASVVFFSPPISSTAEPESSVSSSSSSTSAGPSSSVATSGHETSALTALQSEEDVERERRAFVFDVDYLYDAGMRRDVIGGGASALSSSTAASCSSSAPPSSTSNSLSTPSAGVSADEDAPDEEEHVPKSQIVEEARMPYQFAVLAFEHPIVVPTDALLIASRLDTDIRCVALFFFSFQSFSLSIMVVFVDGVPDSPVCRLAFHGHVLSGALTESSLERIRMYKKKRKIGIVDRVQDKYMVIGRQMFKKSTDLSAFVGLRVACSGTGAMCRICDCILCSASCVLSFLTRPFSICLLKSTLVSSTRRLACLESSRCASQEGWLRKIGRDVN